MYKKPYGLLMIITLFFGCSLSIPKSTSITPSILADDNTTLLDTAISMGQDIFWFASDMLSSILGNHTAIKSDDKRSKIKDHFDTVAKELTTIKSELKKKTNDENTTVKANNIIDKIIAAVNKISGATDANMDIGEISNSNQTNASIVSNKDSVQAVINGVKEIVEIAEKSGVIIKKYADNTSSIIASNNNDAPAVLNGGKGNGADEQAASKLAEEVSKANAWAMIDKIRNATTINTNISDKNDNNAGQLITGYTNTDKGAGAKSNADLAAAVALKAMSKNGKFTVYKKGGNNSNEYANKVKETASKAVNKVLETLDIIIRETLKVELDKVKIKL